VSGLHQGQRAYRPHQKAVHMTAAAKSLVTKVLAKGPSTYDKTILSKLLLAIAIDGVTRRTIIRALRQSSGSTFTIDAP
ncbi:MAG TPA: hypothetical protein VFA80_01215, partial [Xanthobacteraceae bacterium]|nr:hypothetical protein [Xanthobacteraceae bacterium]